MTESLVAIVGGTTYTLSSGNYRHLVNAFGMAPDRRQIQQGPMQHGVSDVGHRLQPRIVPLVLLIKETGETNYWLRRAELTRVFRPSDAVILLRHTAGAIVRQLDCYYSGGLDFGTDLRFVYAHRVPVELYCPDPTSYDPTPVTTSVAAGTVAGAWAIPWVIPWPIGASALDDTTVIAYTGDWDSYPTITITGPITDFYIINSTTGDVLQAKSGVTIGVGDSYAIDCRYGYKTVTRSSDSANRVQDLTDDSDLATFHLAAALNGTASRDNSINVTGTGTTGQTDVSFTYYRRYVGF